MPTKKQKTPTRMPTRMATPTPMNTHRRMSMPTRMPTPTTRKATRMSMPTRNRMATPTPTRMNTPTRMATPTPTRMNTPTHRRMPMAMAATAAAAAATANAKQKVNLLGLLPYGVMDNSVDILDAKQLNMLNLLTRNSLLSVPTKRPVKNPLVFADVKITNNTINTMCKILNAKELHTLILDAVTFDKDVKIKTLFSDVEQLEKVVIKNMRFDNNLILFLSNIPRITFLEHEQLRNLGQEDIGKDKANIKKFVKDKGIIHTTEHNFYTVSQFVPLSSLRDLRNLPKSSSTSSSR